MSNLCIYHGNCADGFGAAWAVREFAKQKAELDQWEFYAGVYQQEPPEVAGKHVVIVDFSYKPEVLKEMAKKAASMLLIDHHKSAMESIRDFVNPEGQLFIDLNSYSGELSWQRHLHNSYQDHCENIPTAIIYHLFDMDRSGAMMAWNFFHPEEKAPRLLRHIQDRDLWKFELPGTRDIQAALFSYPYDFDTWYWLMKAVDISFLRREGEAIERKHHKDIAELLKAMQRRMVIGGHNVPVCNLTYIQSSDAGHIMAKGEPFAACYYDKPEGREFSLRSAEDGMDVSEIARQYGGGGHKHAAGFRVSFQKAQEMENAS